MIPRMQKIKWGISWKKIRGKTTSKMGRQNQEGSRVTAEYKMEEVTRQRTGIFIHLVACLTTGPKPPPKDSST
jgi:hypothetical protein